MKKTKTQSSSPISHVLPFLVAISVFVTSPASAGDFLNDFKSRAKAKLSKIFNRNNSSFVVAPPVTPPSPLVPEVLVFEGPSSALTSIPVTVSELFGEISINSDDFNGWKALGRGLGRLGGWAQSQHRQEKLIEIHRADYEIAVTLVNEIPVVLNEANSSFFTEDPENEADLRSAAERRVKGIPFDGTWAGSKYVFYPHSVVDTDEISDDDKPIYFYLVKNISTQPQDLNFKKGREALHMSDELYYQAVTLRAAGELAAAVLGFEKAAEAGNSRANLILSQFYMDGVGVAKDEDRGLSYLKLAASQGNAEAQYQLGLYSHYSLPATPESLRSAAEFFQSASAQGHLRARFYLAGLYHSGKGIAANPEESKRLFTQVAKASKDGSVLELRAQIRLAHIALDELDESDEADDLDVAGFALDQEVELIRLALGGVPKAMAAVAGLVFDKLLVLPFPAVAKYLKGAAAAGDHEAIIIIKQSGIAI